MSARKDQKSSDKKDEIPKEPGEFKTVRLDEMKGFEEAISEKNRFGVKNILEINAQGTHFGRQHCFCPLPKNKLAILMISRAQLNIGPMHRSVMIMDMAKKSFITLDDETASINVMAICDQDHIFTASNKYIKKWDTTTGTAECLFDLSTNPMATPQNLLVMDENHLATGDSEGEIKIWNISTGKSYKLGEVPLPTTDEPNGCTLMKCNDHTLLSLTNADSATQPRTLQKWSLLDNSCTSSISAGARGRIYFRETSLVISENQIAIPTIDSTGEKSFIRIWDIEKMAPTEIKMTTQNLVTSLLLLPDGRLASASHFYDYDCNKMIESSVIEFFNTQTGEKTSELVIPYRIYDLMLSLDSLELMYITQNPKTFAFDGIVSCDIGLLKRYREEIKATGLDRYSQQLVLDYLLHSGTFVSDASVSHLSVKSKVEQEESSDKKDPGKKL